MNPPRPRPRSWRRLAPAVGGLALSVVATVAARDEVAGPPRHLAAAVQVPEPEPDPDRLAVGELSFRANCLMCHTEEMTSRQRMDLTGWNAEVQKMMGWGAPVPVEEAAPLAEFLTSRFSPGAAPPPAPDRIALADALATILPQPDQDPLPEGDAARGAAPFAAQCATCHGADARGADLGTNLVERPILTRPADFARVVGGGLRRMPGFSAALAAQQQADILAWLRGHRREAPGA